MTSQFSTETNIKQNPNNITSNALLNIQQTFIQKCPLPFEQYHLLKILFQLLVQTHTILVCPDLLCVILWKLEKLHATKALHYSEKQSQYKITDPTQHFLYACQ
jgi:hypothetical protein